MFGPMKNIGIRAGGRTGSLSTLISILYKLYSAARFFKLLPIDGKRNECQTWLYNEEANVLQLHQIVFTRLSHHQYKGETMTKCNLVG